MVDTLVLGTSTLIGVWVRIPPSVQQTSVVELAYTASLNGVQIMGSNPIRGTKIMKRLEGLHLTFVS